MIAKITLRSYFITANGSVFALQFELNLPIVLRERFDIYWNKPFLFHSAQVFQKYAILHPSQMREASFKKHVKYVPISQVPTNANVISLQMVYKLKHEDN